jgi:predicted dithiol-disulfide oxidoreductase (DUF899 family)
MHVKGSAPSTAIRSDERCAFNSDFNYDFHTAHTSAEWESGTVDWPTYRQEGPGVSAFVLDDGVVYHT